MQISNYGSKPNFNTNSQKPKLAFGKSYESKDGSFKFDDIALTRDGREHVGSKTGDFSVKFPSRRNLDDAKVEKAIRRVEKYLAKKEKGSGFNVNVSLRNILNEGEPNSNEMVTGQVTITPKSAKIPAAQFETEKVLIGGIRSGVVVPPDATPREYHSVLYPPYKGDGPHKKPFWLLYNREVTHVIQPQPEGQKSKNFYALVPDKGEAKHPRRFKLFNQIIKAYNSLVHGEQPVKSKNLSAPSIGESVQKGKKELTASSAVFDLILEAAEKSGVRKKLVK